jgi:hypothetical protein
MRVKGEKDASPIRLTGTGADHIQDGSVPKVDPVEGANRNDGSSPVVWDGRWLTLRERGITHARRPSAA